ncbi:Uncharacterized protein F383_30148 [Gossypium arboreum]|uniref:Uncharacterized protein n=1 Tax=Gossypium arboreum TaxID=29729 RepID=A0A0B0PA54_GOSAR|nr:Uncharacterized protein F383_30148 [Gossypium arboreum]
MYKIFPCSFKIICSLRTFTCFERSSFLWWHPLVSNTARLLCFSMFGTRKSPPGINDQSNGSRFLKISKSYTQ